MNAPPDKVRARARIGARREARPPEDRLRADERILSALLATPLVVAAQTAFIYVSIPPEPDTRQLIATLYARGTTVLIPRILNRTTMIAGRFGGWAALRAGPLGIPAPLETTEFAGEIEIAVIPGFGFSPQGDRLGYGAGYYDRWLAAHPRTFRLAIAYECQIDDGIAPEPHDIGMDVLITESRILQFGRRGA